MCCQLEEELSSSRRKASREKDSLLKSNKYAIVHALYITGCLLWHALESLVYVRTYVVYCMCMRKLSKYICRICSSCLNVHKCLYYGRHCKVVSFEGRTSTHKLKFNPSIIEICVTLYFTHARAIRKYQALFLEWRMPQKICSLGTRLAIHVHVQ